MYSGKIKEHFHLGMLSRCNHNRDRKIRAKALSVFNSHITLNIMLHDLARIQNAEAEGVCRGSPQLRVREEAGLGKQRFMASPWRPLRAGTTSQGSWDKLAQRSITQIGTGKHKVEPACSTSKLLPKPPASRAPRSQHSPLAERGSHPVSPGSGIGGTCLARERQYRAPESLRPSLAYPRWRCR